MLHGLSGRVYGICLGERGGRAFYDPEFLKDTTDRGKLCGSARRANSVHLVMISGEESQ